MQTVTADGRIDEQKVAQTVNRSGLSTKLGEVGLLINQQEHFTECVACESDIINENMEGEKKIQTPKTAGLSYINCAMHISRSY